MGYGSIGVNVYKPTVSVVVTFHNIEPRLIRHCVGSTLVQWFDEPYEVILVDDASTDMTPVILNEFADRDNVMVVSLDNNVGPGGARNAGVLAASADLVTFVDGDDFVSPYYLAILLRAYREASADLVCGSHAVVPYSKAIETRKWQGPDAADMTVLDQRGYMRALCYERATESPWNKLGARELYIRHPFPACKSYEDVAVAGVHALSCESFACVETPTYGYVMRAGSVVHKKVTSYRQATDFYEAIGDFLDPMGAIDGMATAVCYRRCLELARLHSVLRVVGDEPRKAARLDSQIVSELRGILGAVEDDREAPRKNVTRFRLLAQSPWLYDIAFAAYEAISKGIRR